MSDDDVLQAKAVQMVNAYGKYFPPPAQMFFGELANFLNWYKLKEVLQCKYGIK
ncbi:hypothetical protein LXA47_02025 [Massilia sp. P8910]|uniref:hypothetical protein n=1 Tax=Massilia antarctica TaxID=2765360 RepID=UPI001E38C71C|nr:hypothetical protein [Massilia antarctica]MCE3602391.1 hypothetical protein [Massilia antarctica]